MSLKELTGRFDLPLLAVRGLSAQLSEFAEERKIVERRWRRMAAELKASFKAILDADVEFELAATRERWSPMDWREVDVARSRAMQSFHEAAKELAKVAREYSGLLDLDDVAEHMETLERTSGCLLSSKDEELLSRPDVVEAIRAAEEEEARGQLSPMHELSHG